MERKESRNGLELIKFAALKLRGNFSALFMGTLAMVTPLALVLIIPLIISTLTGISWIISVAIVLFGVFVGPLQIGYIKYFNSVIDGKQPKLSMVYSQIRFSVLTLQSIYISLILLIMYLIGGVLWIVPAGFAISFYSMSLFFLEKGISHRLSGVMNECAKKMVGNRLAMFSYKLVFYFVYFCLFVIGGLCLGLVSMLAIDSMLVSWIIAVCSTIIFIFMYSFITVYFHSSNQIFFEDTFMYHERKKNREIARIQAKAEMASKEKTEGDSNAEVESKTASPKPKKAKAKKETAKKSTKKNEK